MVEGGDEDDAVEHRHAEERDEAHARADAEGHAARHERKHTADGAHGDGGVDQQGALHAVEGEEEQQEDEGQRDGHRQHQAFASCLQVLEGAAEGVVVGRGHWHFGIDAALELFHEAFHVTATDVHAHGDAALGILPADLGRAGCQGHIGHLLQLDLSATGQRHEEGAHIVDALPLLVTEAHHQIEAALVLVDDAGGLAREGRAHGAVQFADVEAVLRYPCTIIGDGDLWQAHHLFHLRFTRTLHFADDRRHLVRDHREGVHVLTVDLHGHVLPYAGHQFVEAHLDGLGGFVEHAGYLPQGLQHGVLQSLAVVRGGPFVLVLQDDHEVRGFGGHGVRGDLGAAGASHHLLHLRELQQDLLHLGVVGDALAERCALRQDAVEGEVALFQGGNELAAHACEQEDRADEERHGHTHGLDPVAQGEADDGIVPLLETVHHAVAEVGFVRRVARQHQRAHHGHIGEREQQGTQDGEADGDGHGAEHLALDAHQCEDGDVHDQDDDLAEGRARPDLAGAHENLAVHLLAGKDPSLEARMQVVQGGLHDDHGAVHDQSEIDGTKRHQIAADAEGVHEDDGEEHAQWDHRGHDEARAPIS